MITRPEGQPGWDCGRVEAGLAPAGGKLGDHYRGAHLSQTGVQRIAIKTTGASPLSPQTQALSTQAAFR